MKSILLKSKDMGLMKVHYLSILCILSIFSSSCNNSKEIMPEERYKTLVVDTSNQILLSSYPVTLRGQQSVEVRPQVEGTITKICIEEGDLVHKGQILFVIDQIPYKAALETATANVKNAEAKLETARLTAYSKEELYKENVISNFDRQVSQNQLLEAEAALAQVKAEETDARNNLSYTEVKSPVDGIASMIPYRVGALVNSSIEEPLVTVSDDSNIYAYFSMAESRMLDLILQYGSLEETCKNLPAIELTMSNGRKYEEPGRIDAISGMVDEETGSVAFRAIFPNRNRLLRNGGSGTISIPTEYRNCIVIPQSATYELQNKVFTWKVIDGKTVSAPIDIYKYNDGQTYIVTSGLKAGDRIISEGAGLIREGMSVDVDSKTEY